MDDEGYDDNDEDVGLVFGADFGLNPKIGEVVDDPPSSSSLHENRETSDESDEDVCDEALGLATTCVGTGAVAMLLLFKLFFKLLFKLLCV